MIERCFDWLRSHMVDIVIIVFLLCGISYFIGYYANGLLGTHFELNSIGMAIGSFTGAGVMAMIKYITDSCKNSLPGQSPYLGKDERNDINGDLH